jgi:hypothetical protein
MNKDDGDELFSVFVKKVRDLNKSIRWVGIANQSGILIKQTYREGLKPLLTSYRPLLTNYLCTRINTCFDFTILML